MGRGDGQQQMRIQVQRRGQTIDSDMNNLPEWQGLLIEIPRDLNPTEKTRFENIINYWAKLPYVTNGFTQSHWSGERYFWINADSNNSSSSDWRRHRPFEVLDEMLSLGTPERKNGLRTINGFGFVARSFVLSHDGKLPPTKPSQPITKAGQLLTFKR
jgi:hypothetical protein